MADCIYDIIIIGAGPAGMTAAIYAARADKKVILIDKAGFGGNIATSPKVENIPGFTSIAGVDFAENMFDQVNTLGVGICINEAVLISYRYGLFKVSLDSKEVICGKSLIIATGTARKKLDLPTKDIYYCATCDGAFFKNKPIIVVGSGNSGATYALDLASYCKKVYLCDITKEMCCEKVLADRIKKAENIEWLPSSSIKAVENNKVGNLSSVIMSDGTKLKVNAIFAAIGLTPNTLIVNKFVDLNEAGYIISDDCTTKQVPGVFVAGDCRTSKVKQVVTAVSDGAIAALEAIKFLDRGV